MHALELENELSYCDCDVGSLGDDVLQSEPAILYEIIWYVLPHIFIFDLGRAKVNPRRIHVAVVFH